MKYSLKHILEYALLVATSALLRALPYRGALFIGFCAAWCAFFIFGFRVREAERRIVEVFGQRFSKSDIRHIAWISWRNFIFTEVETIRLPVSKKNWAQTVVDADQSVSLVTDRVKTGKGGILATAHMGSWEMAILICLDFDIPLFSLGAPQKNMLVNNFLNHARSGTGFETLMRSPSVLKVIIRKIREGKILAILSDVRGKTNALPIKFLGKTANVAEGMGFIARQTNVPVFPVIITRIGWGRHHYRVYDPIYPDPQAEKRADAIRITQTFFDILSQRVQNEPEQWFWFNRRWIFDPLTKKEAGSSQEPGKSDSALS